MTNQSVTKFFSGRRVRSLTTAVPLAALVALAAWAATPISLDVPRALEAQRDMVAQDPGNASTQIDLGNLLRLEGRPAEAETAYRAALEADPNSAVAHFNLGLLLQDLDRESEAYRSLRRALEIDPRRAWAHYQLGVIEARRGNERRALHAYAQAFALDSRLRFPDVNPHVIDNPLVTRAMLLAYRKYLPAAQPIPTYEEPLRIAGLLRPSADETDETVATAASASPPASTGAGSSPSEAVPVVGRRDDLAKSSRPAGSGTSRSGDQDPAFTRVLDATDLTPNSQTGQVVGGGVVTGATSGRSSSTQPSTRSYRPAPNPQDDAGGGSFGAPAARFRPGTDSSGRLDLHLRPGAPTAKDARG